jgi:DNA repair protein RecN (Recombination protein N)
VLAYAKNARQELDAITHSEERVAELEAEEERLLEALGRLALELSQRRREAAQELAQRVEGELGDLRMAGAQFGVAFERREDERGAPVPEEVGVSGSGFGVSSSEFRVSSSGVEQVQDFDLDSGARPCVAFDATGIDRVEFLVAPNPGEPLKPMTKIASGGETSRLMLALKTVLSRADETPTLIFDEIDQGIGGRVGDTVGEKLWGLAAGEGPGGLQHQVLCVTHLPQLAGFGDTHFRVVKKVEQTAEGERTVTRVETLEGEKRVKELAQMLGGSGEAALHSAEEILEQVARRKGQEAEEE